jgi:hypothetical protein
VKKAMPDAIEPTPELEITETGDGFALVPLEDLMRMKLTSFRDEDRMHLRNLLAVGLVDENWPQRFPNALGECLQIILDNPMG